MKNLRKPKTSYKKKSIFIQCQFKKKSKELYMVSPQKRQSDPLNQPDAEKKYTFQMLIHTPNGMWSVRLLLILGFIH